MTGVIILLFGSGTAHADQSCYLHTERLTLPDFRGVETSKLDLFVDDRNQLYVLNLKADQMYVFSGQPPSQAPLLNRNYFFIDQSMPVIDQSMTCRKLLTKFQLHLPQEILEKRVGFWVRAGYIYLKPVEDHLVWMYDTSGKLVNKVLLKLPPNSSFIFTDIVVDQRGYIYLLESITYQVEVFDADGKFCGIFTKTGNRENELTGSPEGICIDNEGYLYCLIKNPDNNNSQIVKYSYQGKKIVTFPKFGEHHYTNIYVDQYQNLFAVAPEESLIEKFDLRGYRICQFRTTCASGLAVDQQGLVYLNSVQNDFINMLYPDTLIKWIDNGNAAYLDESWDQAEKCFLRAQILDNQLEYIHLALGEVYFQQHQWLKAMQEFEFLRDNWRFSQALTQFRNLLALNYWPLMIAGLLLTWLLLPILLSQLTKLPIARHFLLLKIIWSPNATLQTKMRSMNPVTAVMIIIGYAITHYFSKIWSNPIFNGARQVLSLPVFERNLLIILALTFIWSVTAYKVGELFQGLAKYSYLLNGTAICLVLLIVGEPILALLSHLLTFDEFWVYQCLYGILIGWTVVLFLCNIRLAEDYDWSKTLGVGFVNLAASALFLIFIGFMIGVNQQLVSFLTDIYKEIYNRLTI